MDSHETGRQGAPTEREPLEKIFADRPAFSGEDVRCLRQLQREIAAGVAHGKANRVHELLSAYFDISARGGPARFREWCVRLYFLIEDEWEFREDGAAAYEERLCGPEKLTYQLIDEAAHASEAAEHISRYIDGLLTCRRPLWRDTAFRVVSYVEEYVEGHYMEAICIADIAAAVGLSVNYVRSIFKSSRGKTIQNYLVEYRLEMACRLLRNTSNTVGQVGRLVGYNNESYFCAVFHKKYGKTPSEWRRDM